MSNSLAIATVTAALEKTIHAAIDANGGMPSFVVRTERPHYPPPEGAGVFVFLYRVTPNAAFRGLDPDAPAGPQPGMALSLSYLLSFFGDEAILEPQRLMGIVVGALHANPVLSEASMEEAIAEDGFLAGADLVRAGVQVRLTVEALSVEELSRIWGAFFGPPYLVSIGYQAGPVFISGTDAAGIGPTATTIRVRTEG